MTRSGYGGGVVYAPFRDISQGAAVVANPDELLAFGDCWHIVSAATAALTAVPTTTAGLSLWNGEPANGKVYQIEAIGCVEIVVDATQQNQLGMFALMTKGVFAEPTDSGLVKGTQSGRANYGGYAKTVAAATVVDHVWRPIGNTNPNAAAVAGGAWRVHDFEMSHRGWYVQPGGLFSIAVAKVAATASQIRYFITWREVPRVR